MGPDKGRLGATYFDDFLTVCAENLRRHEGQACEASAKDLNALGAVLNVDMAGRNSD